MTDLPTPEPGDLIRANPTRIAKGQVKADTSRWPSVDTILISNNREKALTDTFVAEVINNANGNIDADKVSPEGDRTILPGDEITISVDTLIKGDNPVADLSAASNIDYVCPLSSRTPGASLKVRIIQISNSIAYADVLSEREPGIELGDRVGVQLTRGNLRAKFGPSRLRSFDCVLNREPVVSGSGTARISAYSNDGIECILEEATNEIQVGDRYKMNVTQERTKAQPSWPKSIGISSVRLEEEATASTTALVELTEVRETVRGRIVEYQNLPALGSTHRVQLERGQDSVHIAGVPVKLASKSKVSGEGTIEIKKEGAPSEGTITEYHDLPSIHTTVTVTLEQDQDFVLHDGVPIELESPSEVTGEVSLEITSDSLPRKGKITAYHGLPDRGDVIKCILDRGESNTTHQGIPIKYSPVCRVGELKSRLRVLDEGPPVEAQLIDYPSLDEGMTVRAEVDADDLSIAYAKKGDYEITLIDPAKKTAEVRVKLVTVTPEQIKGEIEGYMSIGSNGQSLDRESRKKSPFRSEGSRNDEITGKKL